MCNALNGIAIVICFASISAVIGIREGVWHIVITVAIIISAFYSANYFAALESRYYLLVWVIITIATNFIRVWG